MSSQSFWTGFAFWQKIPALDTGAGTFFPVYSYLIVYRPNTKPLQVVSILHGRRDVEQILRGRW